MMDISGKSIEAIKVNPTMKKSYGDLSANNNFLFLSLTQLHV